MTWALPALSEPPIEKWDRLIESLKGPDPLDLGLLKSAETWNLEDTHVELLMKRLRYRILRRIEASIPKEGVKTQTLRVKELEALFALYMSHHDIKFENTAIWTKVGEAVRASEAEKNKEFVRLVIPTYAKILNLIESYMPPPPPDASPTQVVRITKNKETVVITSSELALKLLDLSEDVDPDLIVKAQGLRAVDFVEALAWRVANEALEPEGSAPLIDVGVMVLTSYLSAPDFPFSDVILKFAEEIGMNVRRYISKRTSVPGVLKHLAPQVDAFLDVASEISGQNLRQVGQSSSNLTPREQLKAFRNYLESNLIDQPEVVQAFVDLQFETMVKGAEGIEEPPFFVLMGQPGTGKDTAAKLLAAAQVLFNPLQEDVRSAVIEHMFPVEVQRKESDAWGLLGSKTGYVGSGKLSPYVKFLIAHSGGRYLIMEEVDGSHIVEYVMQNPNWKGQTLPGTFGPESAVIYLNEFGDWSKEAKDLLLKEFLETGYIRIPSPGKGLDRIQLRGIRVIASTNEGTELVTNQMPDGTRNGAPAPTEVIDRRYVEKSPHKDLLKQTLMRTNTLSALQGGNSEKPGISRAIVDRTHPSRIILMKPQSPATQRKIASLFFEGIQRSLQNAVNGIYGPIDVRISDQAIAFVQKYDNISEDNARPIKDKMRAMIEYPFFQALLAADFDPIVIHKGFTLDVAQNEDKTYSLLVRSGQNQSGEILYRSQISYTLKEREMTPVSDTDIDRVLSVTNRIRDNVFGADAAIERVAKALLLAEESRFARRRDYQSHTRATTMAFFGPSSTGKSEMAKAIVRELYPEYGEEKRIDFDFNKVKTDHDMKTMIWGHGSGPTAIPSEFMLKYDQHDGDLLLVLEEVTNSNREVLKGLYDLLREPHPKFADGKDRPMTKVTIILTGNAGIEWYTPVPRDVPIRVQMAAWSRIYEDSMKDPEFQRMTLDKYLPEPLTNRIGQTNIVWFSPHTFKSIRELTLAKLVRSMKNLRPSDGRRGWTVGFLNSTDMFEVVEAVEREGFYLHEQGASIDRYVNEQIEAGLRALLLEKKIPTGARVALRLSAGQSEDVIQKNKSVSLDVLIEGQTDPLILKVFAQTRLIEPAEPAEHQILTGLHETGHELVGRVLLGDKQRSKRISIIPGVGFTGDRWIYYLGVAESESVERIEHTRASIIRQMARLLGGAAAEELYNASGVISVGVHNDIERATKVAERAVLTMGISRSLGLMSFASADRSMMTDQDRKAAQAEIRSMVDEAYALAKRVIELNREPFERLATELIEQGELKSEALESFYARAENRLRLIDDQRPTAPSVWSQIHGKIKSMFESKKPREAPNHRIVIHPKFKTPSKIANIDEIIERDKREQAAKARVPKQLPILEGWRAFNPDPTSPHLNLQVSSECGSLLKRASGQ